MCMISRREQSGYTLIELMVVVALIGIFMSLALPDYIRARDRAVFSEAILAIEPRRVAIIIAAEISGFEGLNDIQQAKKGIPDEQLRDVSRHGIRVTNGEIQVTWRADGSVLDGVTYTLSAQNHMVPIQWIQGGTCLQQGYC